MKEMTIERIYKGLKRGKAVNLTPLLKEDMKVYKEGAKEDEMVTKVTLEVKGTYDPTLIANLYIDKKLEESHFYYLDQKDELRKLLNSWLTLK